MDKYSKLRPPKQTPDSEICKCSDTPPIVLQSSLSYNPISCADCNLEVDVNSLDFNNMLIEKIADWRDFHFCFFKLWLDSGEFEIWAKEQLSNPESSVNKRALIIREEIGITRECFYWWFIDNLSAGYNSLVKCPNCSNDLIRRKNKFNTDTKICEDCNIIVAD
ncbi:MAG: DUF2310 family Zn-ribbon-containing protein [Bacteroidetes bacterium]|nr:DUF2310 family Zn-ribbon-containing protein [Bacteroidota bacterium]